MKHIDSSSIDSYMFLDNYKKIDYTGNIFIYALLSFNKISENWYTIISMIEGKSDKSAIFNFRIKSNHAQWYYGNNKRAVVLNVYNFNKYFKKNEWNEVILVKEEGNFLKIFINGNLVGVEDISGKGSPTNKELPFIIMKSTYDNVLEKLYISRYTGNIIYNNEIKIEGNFDYVFYFENKKNPFSKLLTNNNIKEVHLKSNIKNLVNLKIKSNYDIINDVLFIDNGFLFLYQGRQRQMDYLTGVLKPTIQSVKNFRKNILNRKNYCNKKSIDYIHLVYPSKPVMKSDFLPLNISSQVSSVFLNYYWLLEDTDVLYPLSELKGLESLDKPVFKEKDTHMSDFGYYFVAKIVLRKLGIKDSLLDNIFNIEEKFCSSDLSVMIGDKNKNKEYVYMPSNYHSQKCMYQDNRVFLPSNTGNIVLSTNSDSFTEKNLLVFGDSFFKDNIKFFIPFFKNILFIRSSFFLKDIAELFNPDIVITSNTERYLSNVLLDENDKVSSPLFSRFSETSEYSSKGFNEAWEAFLSIKYYPNIYHSWYSNYFKK